ncbi:hypothetical protein [Nostoc sp. 106C]|nr:hypothetical protein [Nostoc sp. 106C]OUL32379.1 hypothetical protein BV375_10045 [Nostoc sp. 106C]
MKICSNIACIYKKTNAKEQTDNLNKYSEANQMNTSLDKELVTEAVKDNLQKIIHEQINIFQSELEETLNKSSLSAQATDDLRDIQCLISKAKQIEEDKELGVYEKIELVFDKIGKAIEEIEVFQEKYRNSERIPKKVIEDLKNLNDSCKVSINLSQEKLEFIKKAADLVASAKDEFNKDSSDEILEDWVIAIELFAEAIEVRFSLFPDTPLGIFEDFATFLLSKTSNVSYKTTQSEAFRRRIRYASMFILNLVKKERLNRSIHATAEAKAIQRIKEDKDIEWITDPEEEENINIEEISDFF